MRVDVSVSSRHRLFRRDRFPILQFASVGSARLGSARLEQAVTPFPGAQQGGADAARLGQRFDSVKPFCSSSAV